MNPRKVEARLHDDVILGYRCGVCGFVLDESHGGYLYLRNNNGVRVPLRNKDQRETVAQILLDEEETLYTDDSDDSDDSHKVVDIMDERIGYVSACVCMNCLDQFGLDLRKDTIECPHCKSDQVRTFLEMTSKRCPKCQSGQMNKLGNG